MQNLNDILAQHGINKYEMNPKYSQYSEVKNQLFKVDKYETPEPRGGFEKPSIITLYDDKGRYMGAAKNSYEVLQPINFLKSIFSGLSLANYDFSNNEIGYKEINEGKVIQFYVPMVKHTLKTNAEVGDDMETYLLCTTSFDGTQSTRSTIYTKRLVCKNGMVVHDKKASHSFKHTANMNVKAMEVAKVLAGSGNEIMRFNEMAEKLSQIKITPTKKKRIIERITGFSVKKHEKLHTSRQAIMEGIENGLQFEKENTGIRNSAWSLFNAFTYHANHDLDGREIDNKAVTIPTAAGFKLNQKVQTEFAKFAAETVL